MDCFTLRIIEIILLEVVFCLSIMSS